MNSQCDRWLDNSVGRALHRNHSMPNGFRAARLNFFKGKLMLVALSYAIVMLISSPIIPGYSNDKASQNRT